MPFPDSARAGLDEDDENCQCPHVCVDCSTCSQVVPYRFSCSVMADMFLVTSTAICLLVLWHMSPCVVAFLSCSVCVW